MRKNVNSKVRILLNNLTEIGAITFIQAVTVFAATPNHLPV